MITADSARIVLQRNRVKYVRIDILDSSSTVVFRLETEAIDGTININANNQSRRMCNLVLRYSANLLPAADSPIWLNRRMQVFTGILDNITDNIVYFNHGIFYISKVNINITPGSENITIDGLDQSSFLNGVASGELKDRLSIPAGTAISAAIRSTATLGGESRFLIDTHPSNTPFEIERRPGESIWSVLEELTGLFMNWQIYYDVNGFLNFNQRPTRDDDPILWDFTNTDTTLNASGVRDFDNIKNNFFVYGKVDSTTGVQAQATFRSTNANDPTSPFTVERIGQERTLVVTDDRYYTNDQCLQRLNYERFLHTNFNERISFSTVPIDFLDVNQVINYKLRDDPESKFVIDTIDFGLRHDAVMNIGAYKLR